METYDPIKWTAEHKPTLEIRIAALESALRAQQIFIVSQQTEIQLLQD